MEITDVRAVTLVVPLAVPVRLGSVLIDRRELAAVRISTDEGLVGDCMYITRDVPVMEMIQTVAPAIIGRDPLMRRSLILDMETLVPASKTSHARAISLIEVALWDIAAKSAGLPLARLLGGARETVPALQVCGYGLEAGGAQSVRDEVEYFAARGIRMLKLMLPRLDLAATYELVASCRSAAGDEVRLAVDFHYGFTSVADAAETCDRLAPLDLMFVEDPFHPTRIAQTERLAGRISIPIAAGEDAADALEYERMARTVDVLRIDPLTVGGIGPALAGLAVGVAAGCDIFPHGLPELNAAIAGACPEVIAAEVVMGRVADGAGLAYGRFPVIDGHLQLTDEPGLGLELDWAELESVSRSTWSHAASASTGRR